MEVKYKVNKDNQLTVTIDGERLPPAGEFGVDRANNLIYDVAEPYAWRKKNNVPARIILKGKWKIDKDHQFIYSLQETETQAGEQSLRLKTELIGAKADAMIFSLGTRGKEGVHELRYLQLNGKWRADKHNRLQFLVKRLESASDSLTFQGIWQVKQNTLIYTYRRVSLKTKERYTRTLRFEGYWAFTKKDRLTYILDAKSGSSFVFKTYLETPSLIGKKGEIKYRAGIGVKGTRLFKYETITLYGVWKLHRTAGLSYEMDYGDGRVKEHRFEALARLSGKDKVSFKLCCRRRKDLGMSVEFSRAFLKNKAAWFLRAVKEGAAARLELGVAVPW